ncbi:MAG TPA: DUF3105 domain-containing protein [Polyangiaceae bacterium]|nr:DUF3105 domain-containing protein [Polyangiaceae bacterium]
MSMIEHARRPVRLLVWGALFVAASVTVGCGSEDPKKAPTEVGGPFGKCNAMIAKYQVTSADHVAECSELPDADPPYGGPHYPVWAAFQAYDFPIAHGYLIHSMEHGAVVFYYNCPEGCSDEVAQAKALIEQEPKDRLCEGTGVERRAVLVPDPTLDVRWAASAWGYTLRAECFDADVFGQFYTDHYAMAPENICASGTVFTSPPCQ